MKDCALQDYHATWKLNPQSLGDSALGHHVPAGSPKTVSQRHIEFDNSTAVAQQGRQCVGRGGACQLIPLANHSSHVIKSYRVLGILGYSQNVQLKELGWPNKKSKNDYCNFRRKTGPTILSVIFSVLLLWSPGVGWVIQRKTLKHIGTSGTAKPYTV